jgi:GNAT superfamily N-acetyltransferase
VLTVTVTSGRGPQPDCGGDRGDGDARSPMHGSTVSSPPSTSLTVTPRGGLRAVLRPLTPADRRLYLAGFERLGSESRRMRFFTARPSLSEREIEYFTDVDHHDHEAIMAMIHDACAGVARYIRDHDDPCTAVVAVAVVDEWQQRGIGTALLRRIAERASEEGIVRLRAAMLCSNRPMLATLRTLGACWRMVASSDGVAEVEITAGEAAAMGPATAGGDGAGPGRSRPPAA